MDERADPDEGLTGASEPATREEAGSPHLVLDGFTGPLDHLLAMARAQKVDLSSLSLDTLLGQLEAALRQAAGKISLGQKADWVVMAAWLVQLRSLLLLPPEAPARQDALAEAGRLRGYLVVLQDAQALAGWLDRRPQLGHDVFARGRPPSRAQSPEAAGVAIEGTPALDVIEFLWASLALFDDGSPPPTAPVYRQRHADLHTVADARARIRQCLAETADPIPFDALLPNPDGEADPTPRGVVRRRSGWSSTFVASLELAKQSAVVLEQEAAFTPIHVTPATIAP